jgi:hypothetical protein
MHGEPYPPPSDFLVWLEQYVGHWRFGTQSFKVRRRGDGWLEARTLNGSKADVSHILRNGEKVDETEVRRGIHPVEMAEPMM